jgi:peptidoglycan/LPS O-acetylase OafA/YrhL
MMERRPRHDKSQAHSVAPRPQSDVDLVCHHRTSLAPIGGGRPALGLRVLIFFLSGYLITRLLQEERERTGRIHLAAFYRRRCFRIFPAALTYMLVIALLYPVARPALVYAATLHGVLSPVKHSERISSSLVTVG